MSLHLEGIQQLGLNSAEVAAPKKKELGQDQFLKLMTTQLTRQDPTKPMENGDFLAQMAQFSTVEGISSLNDSFNAFATSMNSRQALEASGLVGRSVAFPGNSGILEVGGGIAGNVNIESASNNVSIKISDQNGNIVKTLNLGTQAKGMAKFEWDGQKDDGTYADPGVYRIEAEAQIEGQNTALETFVSAKVESVDLRDTTKGVVLNLGALGNVAFSQVKQVF